MLLLRSRRSATDSQQRLFVTTKPGVKDLITPEDVIKKLHCILLALATSAPMAEPLPGLQPPPQIERFSL